MQVLKKQKVVNSRSLLYSFTTLFQHKLLYSLIMMKKGFGYILALLLVSSVFIPATLASAEYGGHHHNRKNHAFFVPRTMSTTSTTSTASTLLKIRGGAGPINPDTMCKIVAGVAIYQGVAGAVAPKQMNEAYGFSDKDNDALQQFHMKHYGTGILSQGIMVYLVSVLYS